MLPDFKNDERLVAWVPWGLCFEKATMRLHTCTRGGMAVRSAEIRGCVGLVLTKVSGTVVRSPGDVLDAAEGCTSLMLHFNDVRHDDLPRHCATLGSEGAFDK